MHGLDRAHFVPRVPRASCGIPRATNRADALRPAHRAWRAHARRLTRALVAYVFLSALGSAGADTENQRRTLAGLEGVHLHLQFVGDDVSTFGLDEATLRPEIEARLAAAGLRVLDVEASTRTPGVPWLFVEVGLARSSDSKDHAWFVRCELQQRACLERSPAVCESAGTWAVHRFGNVGKRRVKTLRDEVLATTALFTDAFRAANPRTGEAR